MGVKNDLYHIYHISHLLHFNQPLQELGLHSVCLRSSDKLLFLLLLQFLLNPILHSHDLRVRQKIAQNIYDDRKREEQPNGILPEPVHLHVVDIEGHDDIPQPPEGEAEPRAQGPNIRGEYLVGVADEPCAEHSDEEFDDQNDDDSVDYLCAFRVLRHAVGGDGDEVEDHAADADDQDGFTHDFEFVSVEDEHGHDRDPEGAEHLGEGRGGDCVGEEGARDSHGLETQGEAVVDIESHHPESHHAHRNFKERFVLEEVEVVVGFDWFEVPGRGRVLRVLNPRLYPSEFAVLKLHLLFELEAVRGSLVGDRDLLEHFPCLPIAPLLNKKPRGFQEPLVHKRQ